MAPTVGTDQAPGDKENKKDSGLEKEHQSVRRSQREEDGKGLVLTAHLCHRMLTQDKRSPESRRSQGLSL